VGGAGYFVAGDFVMDGQGVVGLFLRGCNFKGGMDVKAYFYMSQM
jgi:hypothetical protein